jgi:hypothetical protein
LREANWHGATSKRVHRWCAFAVLTSLQSFAMLSSVSFFVRNRFGANTMASDLEVIRFVWRVDVIVHIHLT